MPCDDQKLVLESVMNAQGHNNAKALSRRTAPLPTSHWYAPTAARDSCPHVIWDLTNDQVYALCIHGARSSILGHLSEPDFDRQTISGANVV